MLFWRALGCFIAGRLSDRFGRKHLLLWVAVLFALTSVATALSPNFTAFAPVATSVGQTDYSPLGGPPMQVRGPGLQNLDMSLFKIFNIRESTKLEFRAEAFNVGNWVDFGNPGNLDYRNTQDFSQITGTRIDPRILHLALKLYYQHQPLRESPPPIGRTFPHLPHYSSGFSRAHSGRPPSSTTRISLPAGGASGFSAIFEKKLAFIGCIMERKFIDRKKQT